MAIKHVSFDLWGTLIQSHPEYKQRRNDLFIKYINTKTSMEIRDTELASRKIHEVDKLFDIIQHEAEHQLNQHACVMLILKELCSRCVFFKEDLKLLCRKLKQLLILYPPVLMDPVSTFTVLRELRARNITVSILSNTNLIPGSLMDQVLYELSVHDALSFTLYSDVTTHPKPGIQAFMDIVNKVHLDPSSILHVGDNITADGAASKYGFRSLIVNNATTGNLPITQVLNNL